MTVNPDLFWRRAVFSYKEALEARKQFGHREDTDGPLIRADLMRCREELRKWKAATTTT